MPPAVDSPPAGTLRTPSSGFEFRGSGIAADVPPAADRRLRLRCPNLYPEQFAELPRGRFRVRGIRDRANDHRAAARRARPRRGVCVRPARRSRTMACSPCAPRRRRSRAPRPGGRAWSASRARGRPPCSRRPGRRPPRRPGTARGWSGRRCGRGRRPRAPCAGVSSSWPTWTPSARARLDQVGAVVEDEQRAVLVRGGAERFAASISPSSSSDLSRSWIRSAPPRSAASRKARGRASQTRYRRASATRSRGVMPAVLQRYDLCITGARRTG